MSVRFDAETDRISITTALPALTTGITITGWFYLSTDRNDYSALFWAGASGSSACQLETEADGTALWSFNGGGSIDAGFTLTAGAWHRVAMRQNNTTGTVYAAAGSAGSTVSASGTQNNITPDVLHIGGRPSAGEWWNGRAAQVRVFSAALSQAQIEAEWASSTPVLTGSLWADYPLAVHTNLNDASGNGRHLTAGSTATTTEADPPNVGTTATPAAATGTGAANNPTALVRAFPAAATGTGQAFNPTASTSGNAAATPPTATGTGIANNVTAQVVTPVALATGTGAALAPAVRVAALPPTAVGTGQALSPAVRLTAPLTLATGTGAAFNPTALTVPITTATPATATGTGQAFNPIVRLVVIPATAVGTGSAFNPVGAGLSPAFPLRTGTIVDNVARLRTGTIIDNVPRYRARP